MINGERVSIRLMTENDTDNIIKWRNTPHVVNNFIMRTPLTKQMHEGWIQNKINTGSAVQFVIVINETGQDIGSVYLRDIDKENGTGEFGIFIGEENGLSKGYGTEAQRLILEYAFNEIGLKEVILRVLADNDRAINSYKKNGFVIIPDGNQTEIIEGKPVKVIFMKKKSGN